MSQGEGYSDESLCESDEKIVFNVGGRKFETFKDTLRQDGRCLLCDDEFLENHYRKDKGVYFFDRDPDIFRAVLNYLRTGELHLPSYVCGPAAKTELTYWGVPPHKIERCCWTNYSEWNTTLEALQRLEKDRKLTQLSPEHTGGGRAESRGCWERWRPVVWRVLSRSNSSTGAKVFGIVSLCFVFVSIFSFIAETTPPFEYYTLHQNDSIHEGSTTTTTYPPSTNGSVEHVNVSNITESDKHYKRKSKHPVIFSIDMICLTFFTLEYLARFICAPRKFHFFISFMALIDLLAIIPDYVELSAYAVNAELDHDVNAVNYVSVIRVARVLRIFRLVRHVPGLWILVYTLRASFSELMLLVWFLILGILLFASLIFFVDDKEKFANIPEGFWWALITMTTVGYGDMYPTTFMGKIVGSLCAVCGVLMIGFTVPALVNNFMLYYSHVQFALQLENQCEEQKKADKELSDSNKENVPLHVVVKHYENNNKTACDSI